MDIKCLEALQPSWSSAPDRLNECILYAAKAVMVVGLDYCDA